MKFDYRILVVTDGEGSKHPFAVNDANDTIQVSTLCGFCFESEAYHLESWCKEHGFKYQSILMTKDV